MKTDDEVFRRDYAELHHSGNTLFFTAFTDRSRIVYLEERDDGCHMALRENDGNTAAYHRLAMLPSGTVEKVAQCFRAAI